MSNSIVLMILVAAVATTKSCQAAAISKLTAARSHNGEAPKADLPLAKSTSKDKPNDAGADQEEKSHHEVIKDLGKDLSKPVKRVAKVMEDPISAMRGELCLSREAMIGHAKCMNWLVEECTTKSFGTGLCHRVKERVKHFCEKGDDQACKYAKLLGIDVAPDTDDDGVEDKKDAFPEDPKETKDTDGDGIGNNEDKTDNKPPAEIKAAAPAPVAAAPAPSMPPSLAAPAPAPAKPAEAPAAEKKEAPAPAAAKAPAPAASKAPAVYEDPDAKGPLQSQGFRGKPVMHEDMETYTGDWGKEYGHKAGLRTAQRSGSKSWNTQPMLYAAIIALGLVGTA